MEIALSRVYVQIDTSGRIVRCEGGYTTPTNLDGWIKIDEGTGDKYNLCQSQYFDGGLYTHDGIHRYKLSGGVPVLRSEAEIEADREERKVNEPEVFSPASIQTIVCMMAQSVPDAMALTVPDAYNTWKPNVRYGYDDGISEKIVVCDEPGSAFAKNTLYRCITPHTSQADWPPYATPTLWTRINKSNAGTIEDPIPAAASMEYEYGLYYLDPSDSKIYLCERIGEAAGGKITLHYLPHELVGQYFTLVGPSGE